MSTPDDPDVRDEISARRLRKAGEEGVPAMLLSDPIFVLLEMHATNVATFQSCTQDVATMLADESIVHVDLQLTLVNVTVRIDKPSALKVQEALLDWIAKKGRTETP